MIKPGTRYHTLASGKKIYLENLSDMFTIEIPKEVNYMTDTQVCNYLWSDTTIYKLYGFINGAHNENYIGKIPVSIIEKNLLDKLFFNTKTPIFDVFTVVIYDAPVTAKYEMIKVGNSNIKCNILTRDAAVYVGNDIPKETADGVKLKPVFKILIER